MEDDAAALAHRRGPWSNTEDGFLMQLVETHGPLNWVRIAQTLGSRTPKQCRERYHQNLKPSLNHEPITPEEGAQIERLVQEIGKKWAEIARRLHGRSDNAVKNWWNGSQNRRKRFDRRRNASNVPSGEEFYHRTAPMGSSSLGLPPQPTMQSPIERHRQQAPWSEAPLPSPCSSESPDSEAYHYTTSPGRQYSALPHHSVELPPLRAMPQAVHGPSNALPSMSPFGQQSSKNDNHRRQHLLTAPNSPVQQQTPASSTRDSRMNLSSLLG